MVDRSTDDLLYFPDSRRWEELVSEHGATRILLIGVDSDTHPGLSIRRAKVPRLGLSEGTYLCRIDDRWVALVTGLGNPDGNRTSARYDRCEDDHPLAQARQWFESLWDGATPVGPRPKFAVGTAVRLVGSDEVGDVATEPVWSGESHAYTVQVGSQRKTILESGLAAIDLESTDPQDWVIEPPAPVDEFALHLTCVKLTNALSDTFYSYGASKTLYRAYQFKPVLRLLGSPHKRLLIADEVGLGKTIEAGLVWTELEHRFLFRRVLVVCPAMLVSKWRDEMRRRFGRTLRVLDRLALDEMIELFQRGDTETSFLGVVSIERLRITDQLEQLQMAAPVFDLVIVDEAHYLRNQETASYELGSLLSDWADALLFLSATPLNLGRDDLFNLINLLLPSEFPDRQIFGEQLQPNALLTELGRRIRLAPDRPREALDALDGMDRLQFGQAVLGRPEMGQLTRLLSRDNPLSAREAALAKRLLAELHTLSGVVTRTRKVDVPEKKALRQPIPIEVEWTDRERSFYDAVRRWVVAKAKARGLPPGFATQMPLRQTASCIPAMLARLEDSDEEDDLDDIEVADDESGWDLVTVGELRDEVAVYANAIGELDTKFDAFRSELRRARDSGIRQYMVFSFFRRTLAYLAARLRPDFKVEVMHGGVPMAEREQLMSRFREGQFDILLLSEVGSEGLDFEFCNAIVNYDLPWNPMRVEQRIGRLDRFGQQHDKIWIFNFQVPGTIETDIFDRLYRRLRVFEESIGELEPILRDDFADLQRLVLDPRLSDRERALEIRRVEEAFEARAHQLEEIRAAETQLTGLDDLLVEGFEQDIDRGRYVGPTEFRRLLDALLEGTPGAMLRMGDDEITGELIGSAELSRRMLRAQRSSGGSSLSLSELARRFSDGEPLPITFNADNAASTSAELLGLLHPVIRTAFAELRESNRLRVARFGRLRFQSKRPALYLIVVYLVEVTGLRPTLELWPIAVDLRNTRVVEEVGDELLGALARGQIAPMERESLPDFVEPIAEAARYMLSRTSQLEAEQRLTNEGLVQTRMATVRAEADYKVARAKGTLDRISSDRLRRLYEGRIRNVRADEERRLSSLEARKNVAAAHWPVAVAFAEGTDDVVQQRP